MGKRGGLDKTLEWDLLLLAKRAADGGRCWQSRDHDPVDPPPGGHDGWLWFNRGTGDAFGWEDKQHRWILVHAFDPGAEPSFEIGRWAAGQIVEAHTPFISFVLREWTLPRHLDEADLVQVGKVGLLDAITRFQLAKGYRFLTFAYWRIKKELTGYLSEMGYATKVPFPDVIAVKKILNRLDDVDALANPGLFKIFMLPGKKKGKDGRTRLDDRYMVVPPGQPPPAEAIPVLAATTQKEAEGLVAEHKKLKSTKSSQIQSLLSGSLPIHPTEHGQRDDGNVQIASGIETQLVTGDLSEEVTSRLARDEIMALFTELPAVEGVLLSLALFPLTLSDQALSSDELAGQAGGPIRGDETWALTAGRPGVGIEIGESADSLGTLLDRAKGHLRPILRRHLGDTLEAAVDALS